MSNVVMTAKEAKLLGEKFYYTGKPCKHGHDAPRYTSTKGCTECVKNQLTFEERQVKHKAYYEANRELLIERSAKWRVDNYVRYMLTNTKRRAKLRGLDFDLNPEDITIPDKCPILGFPLRLENEHPGGSPWLPSIDRIDPKKGYVRGNVHVISFRANNLKSDGTAAEHALIAAYMGKLEAIPTVSP